MANHKSAIKRNRQNEKRNERNKTRRSKTKNVIKDVLLAVGEKNVEEAQSSLKEASRIISKNTAKDFSDALNDLKDLGMTGLVIDLRGNSGGLLSNAINIYRIERNIFIVYISFRFTKHLT